ncbi:Hpt domain-containing protein [Acidimangrovimonas sediminis]|uniref:Hpt domain-containing protein n=1 Tax=Acidimangrovimonas sediminis TaxID=2056283 RepID=UPI000C7FB998|nr:Hpt domain-containing protein [Acidimangrovimonas sediminis]
MIDWTRVETLFDEIGGEDFCEVVQIFLEETDGVVARLETDPDPARYEEELHFLKGSALNLGFTEMAQLCQTGERLAAQGAAAKVDIGAVLNSYRASVAAFRERSAAMCRQSSAA